MFCSGLMLMCINTFGQGMGVNTNGAVADPSAMLDVTAADKGILIPRVSSLSNVTLPASGLMVMLLNGSSDTSYYYNSGTPAVPRWLQLFPNPANKQLDMTNKKITNLALCTQNPDAANKAYVDAQVAGLGGGGCCGIPSMLSSVSPYKVTMSEAVSYCDTLNYGGFTDWRIPTYDEISYFFGSTTASDTLWTKSLSMNAYYPNNQNYISVKLNDGKWYNGGVTVFWPYSEKSVSGNTANTTWTVVATMNPMAPGDAFILNAIRIGGSCSPSYSSAQAYFRLAFKYVDGTTVYSPSYNTNNSGTFNQLTSIPVVDGITPLSSIDLECYGVNGGTAYGTLYATYYDFIFNQKDGNKHHCRCVR
jgi:hypothetical protein